MQRTAEDVIRSTRPDKRKTTISKVRELFPAIEEAKRNGVSHIALVAALEEAGIHVSVKSLSRILMQIRRDGGLQAVEEKGNRRGAAAVSTSIKSGDIVPPLTSRTQSREIADMFITSSNPLLSQLKSK